MDVLIADDHPLIRAGIRAVLSRRPEWNICAEVDSGDAALRSARQMKPRLIVLDYSLPGINGLEVTRQLANEIPDSRVLIYTMHSDERILLAILQAGARGYVLKTEDDVTLLEAMDTVAAGGTYISAHIAQPGSPIATATAVEMLTARELEVVRLVAMGESNKTIALQLEVSVKTVDLHRTTAMRKLGLHTAVDVTLFAVRNGIVQL